MRADDGVPAAALRDVHLLRPVPALLGRAPPSSLKIKEISEKINSDFLFVACAMFISFVQSPHYSAERPPPSSNALKISLGNYFQSEFFFCERVGPREALQK